MEIIYSGEFIKSAKRLPKSSKIKLASLLELLKDSQFHPKLHTKPLVKNFKGFYSLRITRDWRVIFTFQNPQNIILVDVAHRKDIYK